MVKGTTVILVHSVCRITGKVLDLRPSIVRGYTRTTGVKPSNIEAQTRTALWRRPSSFQVETGNGHEWPIRGVDAVRRMVSVSEAGGASHPYRDTRAEGMYP